MILSFDEYQELLVIASPEQLKLDTPLGEKFVELTLSGGQAPEDEVFASLPDYLTVNEVAQVTEAAVTSLGQYVRNGQIEYVEPESVPEEYRAHLHKGIKYFVTPDALRRSEVVNLVKVYGWNQERAASVINSALRQKEGSKAVLDELKKELDEAKIKIYVLERTNSELRDVMRDIFANSRGEDVQSGAPAASRPRRAAKASAAVGQEREIPPTPRDTLRLEAELEKVLTGDTPEAVTPKTKATKSVDKNAKVK